MSFAKLKHITYHNAAKGGRLSEG